MSSLPGQIIEHVLTPAIKKKMFSEPTVSFQRYFGCYEQVFETGAVLGHAFQKDFVWFVQFFSQPGRAETFAHYLSEMATEHLKAAGEATTFLELAMYREESRVRQTWRSNGKTEAQIEERLHNHGLTQQQAVPELNLGLNLGLGVGGAFPDLVERLWRDAYELPIDARQVDLFRKAGMSLPKTVPETIPLRRQQEYLLSGVRSFLRASHPALIARLDSIVEVGKQTPN